MPRYRLTIAYDGTDFCGWQKQEPPLPQAAASGGVTRAMQIGRDLGLEAGEPGRVALRTVQAVVEKALREVVREPVSILGASRTDAGVHANGQIAAFDASPGTDATGDETGSAGKQPVRGVGWPIARGVEPLKRAVNARLPEDVLIRAIDVVRPDFNPIGDAISKGYAYTMHVSPDRPLWRRRYVHHVWTPLDTDRMNEGAAHLVGEHDFAALAAAGHGRKSTVRTIHDCRVTRPDETTVRIDVSGNGFLWNMVRIIAGTLMDVGRGRTAPEDVAGIIESGDRSRAGPTLPASGLCLEWIRYADDC